MRVVDIPTEHLREFVLRCFAKYEYDAAKGYFRGIDSDDVDRFEQAQAELIKRNAAPSILWRMLIDQCIEHLAMNELDVEITADLQDLPDDEAYREHWFLAAERLLNLRDNYRTVRDKEEQYAIDVRPKPWERAIPK